MTIEQLNILCKNTMIEHLGIEYIEIGSGKLIAKMGVNHRTVQPMKRLHGGALLALAESVGSAGSMALVNPDEFMVLGTEINATHTSYTDEKEVYGVGTLIHQGKSQHIWQIRVEDKTGKLISICRMTNRILPITKK
ncbi:MAG: hotdog fold thioesterase [Paludibacteraceae bacterium]